MEKFKEVDRYKDVDKEGIKYKIIFEKKRKQRQSILGIIAGIA